MTFLSIFPILRRWIGVRFTILGTLFLLSCGGPPADPVAPVRAVSKAASAAAVVNWVKCANEDQTCTVSGTTTVRFGLNGTYNTRTVTGSVQCTVQVFGDPAYGVDKICEYDAGSNAPPAWTACAVEGGTCTFAGTQQVRYGANGSYFYQTATGSIACTNAVFGDPAFGADKHCDRADAGTAPPPPPPPPPPVTSSWTACAVEDATCTFSGRQQVRFGANGLYYYRLATSKIACTTAVFGDPAFGVNKTCDYQAPPSLPSAWSNLIPFPIVPVAAANLSNGKVLTWSAYSPTTFGGDNGKTDTALFNPATLVTAARMVTQTGHDMFCPGTSLLADGRVLANGGSSSQKTSLYNPATDTWSTGALMNVARGYQGNATLANGSVLTLGGSWSGPLGGKNGEIWTAAGGWRSMPGIAIEPFLGPDPDGVYRADNHLWLFAQANGKVFHAGPSAAMHWIDTAGAGNVTNAGARGDDAYSMNGNAVMYDIGKILKTGGAPAYEETDANAAAYVIDINGGSAVAVKSTPMNYARAMHNSVVLPNGQVVITGGQSYVKIFSDDRSILMPELWDPDSKTFATLTPMTVPRNYHSFSLLLPDGRVLAGGGGLCDFNCTTNHLDAQILTPPYLLNADGSAAARPTIASAPAKATYGASVQFTTDGAVSSFVLMRLSSATHSLNNDQRRVPLRATAVTATSYSATIPTAGIVTPGFYMLFALNAAGVPSVSKTIQIQ